jgi:hypothetical protein
MDLNAGVQLVSLDEALQGLGSGTYFLRLTAGEKQVTKKIVVE